MAVAIKLIRSLAPVLRLHPDEKYNPMDPEEFIRLSRFRHHKSWGKDQGYNRVTKKWVTSNSHSSSYYNVPVSYINRFKSWTNGENRRPRDSNRGDKWNVFLEPKGKPAGENNPNGLVPVFYYAKTVDTTKIPEIIRKMYNIKAEKYDKIQYWWFFGYNDGPGLGGVDNHQGDWEHVTCKVKNNRLIKAYFAQHGTTREVSRSKLKWTNGRFIVYSAIGSHGSYESAGSFPLILGASDETANGGCQWDTSLLLKKLNNQPWRDFAGAWGQVGQFAHTTGPLGPWYKRTRN